MPKMLQTTTNNTISHRSGMPKLASARNKLFVTLVFFTCVTCKEDTPWYDDLVEESLLSVSTDLHPEDEISREASDVHLTLAQKFSVEATVKQLRKEQKKDFQFQDVKNSELDVKIPLKEDAEKKAKVKQDVDRKAKSLLRKKMKHVLNITTEVEHTKREIDDVRKAVSTISVIAKQGHLSYSTARETAADATAVLSTLSQLKISAAAAVTDAQENLAAQEASKSNAKLHLEAAASENQEYHRNATYAPLSAATSDAKVDIAQAQVDAATRYVASAESLVAQAQAQKQEADSQAAVAADLQALTNVTKEMISASSKGHTKKSE